MSKSDEFEMGSEEWFESLTRPQVGSFLKSCGGDTWKDFNKRRKGIIKTLGVGEREAHRIASREYRPLLLDGARIEKRKAEKARAEGLSRGAPFEFSFPMCDKADFMDRVACTSAKAVDWVFDNVAIQDATAGDAPSPGAWALLCWCRLAPGNLTEFMRTIWPKRLPSRTQVDDGAGLSDDGRTELIEIEQILADSQEELERDRQAGDLERTVEKMPVPGSVVTDDDRINDNWNA